MKKPEHREKRIETSQGSLRIHSFCTPEEIDRYSFHHQFSNSKNYKSLYTQKDSLSRDAARPEANVVLVLTSEDVIVGFGVLAYPDGLERWAQLGPGHMIEVRVIEVSRHYRSSRVASQILESMLIYPGIEEKITYMVGYSWTWDLQGTGLDTLAYRQVLIKLFSAFDFLEVETNEPNICLKQENLFMCRLGQQVSEQIIEQFNWLRFGIAPEPGMSQTPSWDVQEAGAVNYSLFEPMKEEGLTNLGIYYDWKTGRLTCRASREWDAGVDWRRYNQHYSIEHPLIQDTRFLNHDQTLGLFHRYALRDYLDRVMGLLKKRRSFGLECYLNSDRTIYIFHFIHSSSNTTQGGRHIYHALRAAPIQYYTHRQNELDIIAYGLNLSRAMSFKCMRAGLPFGGGAFAIQCDAFDTADNSASAFLGYILDRTRSFVMLDFEFPSYMIDVFKQKEYSFQISSRKQNSIGPQEAYTAYGVYLALKEVLNFHFGSGRLVGKKVVVDGGGSVGYALITKYLSEEIEEIYVAESDEVSIEKLRASLPGRIHILNPEKVLSFDGDILVPCAEGGILDESGIDGISYSAILGGVDNILKADTEEEEIELANILASKGIFYQVDWLHNSGGLISALEAYINQGLENLESVRKHVEKVCRDSVRDNLYAARVNGVTPTEQAYQDYESMIYPSV